MNAYSQDLRKKIVEAVSERGMGKSEAARTFGVSLSSVKRYVRMASKGELLAPKRRPGSKPKLEEKARRLLASDLEERPFVTLSERRDYLEAVAGVSVSNSTVCRQIKRIEHTRKKGVDTPPRARRVREGGLAGDGGRARRCSGPRLR